VSEPYVGEIRMFGGNFAPAGWMFCEGQQLPISEYETLFNLIGTTYGGDGQSNPTEETLQKMRLGFTGKHTPEAIAKIKAARARQVMTPERNAAVSRGKKRFEELKRAAFFEKKPAAHQTNILKR